MLQVYGRASSINVQKVMWAVGELALPHQRHDLGGAYGGLDTPDYKAKNPHRRVPTIEDGGTVVWESNAIIRYLAARYGSGTLWDEDPGARAQADQWMDWMQTTLAPDFYGLFWAVVRTPVAQQDGSAIAALRQRTLKHFQLLDATLSARPWLAGERFTMADIPAGATLFRWQEIGQGHPPLPALEDWHRRLRERAAYRQHVEVSYEELRGRLT